MRSIRREYKSTDRQDEARQWLHHEGVRQLARDPTMAFSSGERWHIPVEHRMEEEHRSHFSRGTSGRFVPDHLYLSLGSHILPSVFLTSDSCHYRAEDRQKTRQTGTELPARIQSTATNRPSAQKPSRILSDRWMDGDLILYRMKQSENCIACRT